MLLPFFWFVAALASGCTSPPPPKSVPSQGPLSSQVDSLRAQGHRWTKLGDHAKATQSYEHAKRLAESIDDLRGLADALNDLGAIAMEDGLVGQSVTLHRQALALAEQVGEDDVALRSMIALAGAEHQVGRSEDAQQLYERAMVIARRRNDRSAEAVIRNNVGLVQQTKGDTEGALRSFQEALETNRALGDARAEASNHVNLALLAEAGQQYEQAEQEMLQALDLDKTTENRTGIAGDLSSLSRLAVRRGFIDRGLGFADRAYRSYKAQGDMKRAAQELSRALELARKVGGADAIRRYEEELKSLPRELIRR